MARHRGQRRAVRGGVAGRVDRRVRRALQKLIELEPAFLMGEAGGVETETREIGHPPGGVNHEVGVDARWAPSGFGLDAEPGCTLFDSQNPCATEIERGSRYDYSPGSASFTVLSLD